MWHHDLCFWFNSLHERQPSGLLVSTVQPIAVIVPHKAYQKCPSTIRCLRFKLSITVTCTNNHLYDNRHPPLWDLPPSFSRDICDDKVIQCLYKVFCPTFCHHLLQWAETVCALCQWEDFTTFRVTEIPCYVCHSSHSNHQCAADRVGDVCRLQ